MLERINKLYPKYQMVSAGIDLLTEVMPANTKGQKASPRWCSVVSAGGPLRRSAGFALRHPTSAR